MRSEVRAILVALLLVVFGAGIGVAMGARARPAPTPRPVPSPTAPAPASAAPVDPADVQRRAFAQPLVTGCATAHAVWLFADGGFAVRYDGRAWTIADPTLRSMLAAECDQATVLAVGRGGQMLTIDDELRQVRPDRFGTDDLTALSRFSSGAVAVGSRGTVAQQSDLGWGTRDTGMTEDLLGVAFKDPRVPIKVPLAWVVGAGGVSYRLMEQGRWERVPTGVTATLRAVVQPGDVALAAGDRGTLLRFVEDRWASIASGTDADLRAIAIVAATTAWIVGDKGTVIELSGDSVRRVDLRTACTLRAVFTQGSAVWVVGSDGVRGGAWRVTPSGTDRWGTC